MAKCDSSNQSKLAFDERTSHRSPKNGWSRIVMLPSLYVVFTFLSKKLWEKLWDELSTRSIHVLIFIWVALFITIVVLSIPRQLRSRLWKESRGLTVALITILLLVAGGAMRLGFTIWPRVAEPTVEFSAHIPKTEGPYPPKTKVGGVILSPGLTDVRVNLNNGPISIRDLDFDISTDALIKAVGQVSDLPNVNFQPVSWI
ncbi:MAG: hypothetical protein QOH31_2226, partial [Verrucomicrobiota bacterium]